MEDVEEFPGAVSALPEFGDNENAGKDTCGSGKDQQSISFADSAVDNNLGVEATPFQTVAVMDRWLVVDECSSSSPVPAKQLHRTG